ncbi:NAD(P)-dependent oxidoreductase [Novosphingobium rosa]|uniref:NAD(P)-dependent oxidoreductase n=1 Tax=Novosphingobium rosa TaxID=76978 RepID=UPI000836DCF4|nr:NAD(P)-dependent oxidoreductase [Novosphingobium rosa]
MSLIVASQMDADINQALSGLPLRPQVIPAPGAEPWRAAEAADVLIIRPSPEWIASRRQGIARPAGWPGRLRWVFSASAGIDFYPEWLLDAPLVSCGRGTASEEIADYVIAAIYRQAKDLDAARVRSASEWRQIPLGQVAGSTVGLVGLGAIGQAVARRAVALGARVVAARRSGGGEAIAGVEVLASVDAVVERADHIVIAVPATTQTLQLFNARLLARARPGAHLVNVARGSVVDQEALLGALDTSRLGFATLDVTDPEPLPEGHRLYTHPRVRITPHISSNYTHARARLLEKLVDNIDRFARGQKPHDLVDVERGY